MRHAQSNADPQLVESRSRKDLGLLLTRESQAFGHDLEIGRLAYPYEF
jgi:hypothetical protein